MRVRLHGGLKLRRYAELPAQNWLRRVASEMRFSEAVETPTNIPVESAGAIKSAAAWKEFMAQSRSKVLAVCVSCGGEFNAVASEIKRGKGKCCSLSCAAALAAKNRDQKGAANNNWKGGLADQSNAERKRRYREKNPDKHIAHLVMRNAIRSGILVRKPCEVCGSNKTEGHHDDYSYPLAVRWLCKKHHLEAHGGKFSHLEPESSPAR